MRIVLFAVGAIGAIIALRATAANSDVITTENSPMVDDKENLRAIFAKWGNKYGVDPLLIEAHAIQESNLNPTAVRWNPPTDISVGLMQILYIPQDLGDPNSRPKNRFSVDGWLDATFDKLKDPDFNVMIGVQIMRYNIRTYGMPRAVAVYNQYSARLASLNGPFPNQRYVDNVLRNYAQLQEAAA